MAIDPKGEFTMDGDYVINRGSFFLTLQSILNRNFEIRRGSNILWTGDPYNAEISLKAVYKVKTKLGLAKVDRDICLPWNSKQQCLVCEEHCPVPDKAIKIVQAENLVGELYWRITPVRTTAQSAASVIMLKTNTRNLTMTMLLVRWT